MLKNYLKIAFRNMAKNKVFSLINILGLSIGMAACLLIIQYVRFEWSYEDFHKNADNIYRVTLDLYNGSEYVVTDCETYGPFGPMVKDQMPEVIDFVRIFNNEPREVKADNKMFLENRIYFADSTVFKIFTYNVLQGDPATALTQPFEVVITQSIANKYFGRTDIIGQSMQIEDHDYKITAVMDDVPPNTHIKFDILISHVTINQIWDWYERNAWNGNNEYTYLLMAPGTNLDNFNKKLTQLSIDLKDKIGDERFVAEPIKDIHLYSHKTFEPETNGNAKIVSFLTVIALLILIIAWVNYINLSTARAMDRAREVGIRKVIGSVKRQLVIQFLFESVIMSFLATLISILLIYLSLPVFRNITGQPLNLNIINDSVFWYILFVLLFMGTVLSSMYPALVLSSFQPISVLKGKLRSSGHGNGLRKGLVVFQFTATVILIVCTSTVYLQIKHLRNIDLGMDINQVLAIQTPHADAPRSMMTSYKEEILRIPEVNNVAISESLPGLSLHQLSTTSGIRRESTEHDQGGYNYYIIYIDEDYIPTMNMQIIAGRNFQKDRSGKSQVIVNEEAVRLLGFANADEAIGSKITYSTNGQPNATIIGVIKNYHQQSPKEHFLPMIFPFEVYGGYYSVRLSTNNIRETISKLEKTWYNQFPNSVFNYFFLDNQYNQQYKADTEFGKIVAIFSTLAIFIACLGLFGLASLISQNRIKEIGIRKVNGARVSEILALLNKDFVMWVFIAFLIATPIAWYAMSMWLDGFAYKMELHWWIFVMAGVVEMVIALVTVSWLSWRAATRNPVEALRYE